MADVNDPAAPLTTDVAQARRFSSGSPLWLVLALVGAGLAVYIGVNVIGVLFNIVSPPEPPLPDAAVETSHESPAYGVNYWRYTVSEDACSILEYYLSFTEDCMVSPMACASSTSEYASADRLVARCYGNEQFSLFSQRWEAVILRNELDATTTRVDVSREVNWTG